jgi:predicted ATPase
LVSFLKGRQVLLVLDNFEHLIGAAPMVVAVLGASPNVRVVVTSRSPLRISGEAEVAVPPLGMSSGDGAEPSEGARLFIDRARSIRPDLQLTDDDAAAIEEIVTRLDGLPLAIELAASRANVLTPVQVLDRLGNKLLSSTAADLPPRQRTMAAAIGWSYDLLDESTRKLFQRCSVFSSGAGLTEIEAVCADDEVPIDDVLDGLAALVDDNLMVRRPTSHGLRFAMLSVIREFAAEQLDSAGRTGHFRARHQSVYGDLVDQARPLLVTSARPSWLDRIAADHDNVRAALDHAVAAEDVPAAYGFLGGMWRFWQTRGPLAEARDRAHAVLALSGGEHAELRVRALLAAGGIAYWSGEFDGMEAPYREAVEIARRLGDEVELSAALYEFSFVFSSRGDSDEATAMLQEAMVLAEAAGDTYSKGRAEFGFFNVNWYKSRTKLALEHARAAAAALSDIDAPYDLGWAEWSMGDSLMRLGDTVGAAKCLDTALPRFVAAGDLSAMILFFKTYAAIASLDGDTPRAARLAGAAESLQEVTGAKLYTVAAWVAPNKAVTELIGELDEEASAEYQAGRRMGAEAAAAYALSRPAT